MSKKRSNHSTSCYFCEKYNYFVTREICLNRYKMKRKLCDEKCKILKEIIENNNGKNFSFQKTLS
ncbi:MAG: hypothetical protein ACE5WD_06945 [Candidatus Aminicenantia bacterium]